MSDTAQQGDSSPKRPMRRGRLALVISLAFNLAFVGLVAGTLWGRSGGHHAHHDRESGRELDFGPYTGALSAADRQALRRALVREAEASRGGRRELRRSFDTLLAALRAEPFDRGAAAAAMAGQRERIVAQMVSFSELLLDRIAAMPTAERLAFADRMESALRRGPPRPGGDDAATDNGGLRP